MFVKLLLYRLIYNKPSIKNHLLQMEQVIQLGDGSAKVRIRAR